jgi:SAM-dependent methyltransferase
MKNNSVQSVGYPAGPARYPAATSLPGSRTALHDPRWPAIAGALRALRDRGRFAVRIVDAGCGAGCLLLHAVHHARSLGFTSIEGRGIDGSPALIGRAKAAAQRQRDPAIGTAFDRSDVLVALGEEYDLPADLVLWHGTRRAAIDQALARAADLVIRDDAGDAA